MKISKAELRKLARQIITTNLAMWQAIHGAEELYYDEVRHMSEENLEELAKIMTTLKNGTEQMADPEHNSLYFQEFEYFGNKLQEYLDKYED